MPGHNMKPDFPDIDGDGNTTEPISEAAQEPDAQKFKDEKMDEGMKRRRG